MASRDSNIEPRTDSSASTLCGGTRSYVGEALGRGPPSGTERMAIGLGLLTLPRLRGYDLHSHVRLDLRVQPDGDAMWAGILDGGVDMNAAPVDAGTTRLGDRIDDLGRGDRPEQATFLACLGRDHDPQRLEVCRHGSRLLEIGDLSGDAP